MAPAQRKPSKFIKENNLNISTTTTLSGLCVDAILTS